MGIRGRFSASSGEIRRVPGTEGAPGVSGSPGYSKMYWIEPRWIPSAGRHGPSGYTGPRTKPSSSGSE